MRRLTLATTVLVLCAACGPAAAADVHRIIDADGPAEGVRPLALRELWRVGGEDEDVIFGRISDLKLGPDGSIYVLDNQLCHVVVISAEGEHLRDISRQGDGPGELRQPMGLIFLADDLLGVGMGFPGKLVTLGLDGTPRGDHWPVGAPADGNLAVMISLHFVDGVLGASGGSIVVTPGEESHTDRFLSVGDASCGQFRRVLQVETPFDPTGYTFVEADDYYIDLSLSIECLYSIDNLLCRAFTLNRRGTDEDFQGGESSVEHMQNVANRGACRRRDDPDPCRKSWERSLVFFIK